uniref:Uncharacterized protein n=1 Tax=Pectobacterium phage Amona TaxID=3158137 RepID=A0AB39ABD6_9CAUD
MLIVNSLHYRFRYWVKWIGFESAFYKLKSENRCKHAIRFHHQSRRFQRTS